MRQKGILLRLVEAMNLVAEENCAPSARAEPRIGFLDDFAHARDPFRHCAELHERGPCSFRDDAGECRFAGAGRAPEDETADLILFDQLAERFAWAEEMRLPHV